MVVQFFQLLGFEIADPDQFLLNGTLIFAPFVFGILYAAGRGFNEGLDYHWPAMSKFLYSIVLVGLIFFFSWTKWIP